MFPANPDHPRDEINTAWAWGHGDPETEQLSGYGETIRHLLTVLERYGPFIGIKGFSTGAALAAVLSSMLEKRETYCEVPFQVRQMHWFLLRIFSLLADNNPPFGFAVCFSGFRFEHEVYDPIYSQRIETPILHVVSNLDTMIEPAMTKRLAGSCGSASIYQFSGGHHIPRSADSVRTLREFVKQALSGRIGDSGSGSEDEIYKTIEYCLSFAFRSWTADILSKVIL
ncbi:hypothetical protein N7520_009469 [Penicillium odoratum]|uniref:uncharacterized protein n=1 Tax=Penicillium odoratum TaxID=1167516 RepID=UPI0025487B34|nr:uncharacterized protein N7520_009469 [Penicillium odoratum]KAJ5752552.1 hypothetical protein N7520_009469 [Penicillium odoratum]